MTSRLLTAAMVAESAPSTVPLAAHPRSAPSGWKPACSLYSVRVDRAALAVQIWSAEIRRSSWIQVTTARTWSPAPSGERSEQAAVGLPVSSVLELGRARPWPPPGPSSRGPRAPPAPSPRAARAPAAATGEDQQAGGQDIRAEHGYVPSGASGPPCPRCFDAPHSTTERTPDVGVLRQGCRTAPAASTRTVPPAGACRRRPQRWAGRPDASPPACSPSSREPAGRQSCRSRRTS